MRTGLLAEFTTAEALAATVQTLVDRGYRKLDTYTPYPLESIGKVLRLRRSRIPLAIFPIAVLAAALGYGIQWYTNAIDYRLNAGGRPPHAVPAFVPITFETCILISGLATAAALFIKARLLKLWQPIFDVPGFERATVDRFWLGIDATDPKLDAHDTSAELAELGATRVVLVTEKDTRTQFPAQTAPPEGAVKS